jgi:hypothetical protein
MSASLQIAEKCCPICGRAASEPTYRRFGKFWVSPQSRKTLEESLR